MTRLKTGSYEVVRLTHWNTQEADSDLDTRNGDHGRPNATINDPVVGLPSQGEAEEVLKDDHACEALDSQVTCHDRCKWRKIAAA